VTSGTWGAWAPTPDDWRDDEWCASCGKRTDTNLIECLCLIEAAEEAEEREIVMEVEGLHG
jgi:hypothetical protein